MQLAYERTLPSDSWLFKQALRAVIGNVNKKHVLLYKKRAYLAVGMRDAYFRVCLVFRRRIQDMNMTGDFNKERSSELLSAR